MADSQATVNLHADDDDEPPQAAPDSDVVIVLSSQEEHFKLSDSAFARSLADNEEMLILATANDERVARALAAADAASRIAASVGNDDDVVFIGDGGGGGGGGGGAGSSSSLLLSQCPWCHSRHAIEKLGAHATTCVHCPQRYRGVSAPLFLLSGAGALYEALQPSQEYALNYVAARARAASEAALASGSLQQRIARLGFPASALGTLLCFVRDTAPLIIHVSTPTLKKLILDTHYRSQAEITGGLTSYRKNKEDALFDGAYKDAKPAEKPKYGVLNMTGDNRGVISAHMYGRNYLILKPHVRARATFSNRNSEIGISLAMCENYAHVLNEYTDAELSATLRVGGVEGGQASFVGVSGAATSTYKEAQIHGLIDLKRDVESIVGIIGMEDSPEERGVKHAFAKRFGCNFLLV